METERDLAARIEELVDHYENHKETFDSNALNLSGHLLRSSKLRGHIHTVRARAKDPEHLRDKLYRKAKENDGKLIFTKENLFAEINDLAGVRILHLHTRQMKILKELIEEILTEQQYKIIEGPIAHTWDDESRAFFETLGIETVNRKSLYTSIHYILKNNSRTQYTCELQVRTLMEEVWGEVSHIINYPHETSSVACKEQLMVLARVTSAGSRLVDSLFSSHVEFHQFQDRMRNQEESTQG